MLPVSLVPIPLPPDAQICGRGATRPADGEKRNRYHLPASLESGSPVAYRTRLPLTQEEADAAAALLTLPVPDAFVNGPAVLEKELFEESSLGILSSRQSTNFRGFRQVTLGPSRSAEVATLLGKLQHREGPALDGAAYTHVVLGQPYRTPFTFLLTFIGHKAVQSLLTVPLRAWRKKTQHATDIPTIGYLPHLHVGILAESMERAAVIASEGRRRANVLMAPFAGDNRADNIGAVRALEDLVGLTSAERRAGWGVQLVAQVGAVADPVVLPDGLWRRLGANLLAFRSERIQPGVNQEAKAPPPYQARQDMDVPEALATMAGRAAYNALTRWTGVDRDTAKVMMLLERVDVLTPGGKDRLRAIRTELSDVTDQIVDDLPLWADLPTGKALSRNAARGKKAFALAGQRIYIGGLDRTAVQAAGLSWEATIRAAGAAAARSAFTVELAGCIDLPEQADLLAGVCLMAGPVNQNDIGKEYYGRADLLAAAHPGTDPTSLLVWTLKAKTVADPVGNEEQLLNPARKGALVDLRAAPHEVCFVETATGAREALRSRDGQTSQERAYGDLDNFVRSPDGADIEGNPGAPWPESWANETLW